MRLPLLLLIALILPGCAAPLGRLNDGAAFPYVIVTSSEMARDSSNVTAPWSTRSNWVIMGLCARHRITELHANSEPWVPVHEALHLADRLGSLRAAIIALTPPNPNAHMAARLKLMEEVDAAGPDYWRTIYLRWGKDALGGHQNIIARVEAQ
jgi:hypothetical protein